MISGQSFGSAGVAWNRYLGIAVTLAVCVLVEVFARTPLAIPNPGPVYLLAVVFAAFSGGIGAGFISAIIALAGTALNLSTPGHPLLHYSDFDRTRLIVFGIVSPAMAVLVGILKRRADAYHERARAALVQEAALEACRDAVAQVENAMAEQKRGAAALRESEEAFRLIAENISEVFWIIDPSRERVVYLSPAFEQLWGSRSSDDRDVCRTITGWMDPDAGFPLPVAGQRGSESEESVGERQITRPDRAVRWIRFRVFPIRNDHGEVHRIAGVAEDITELKLAENARIAETERQSDALVSEVHHRIKNHLQGVIGLLTEHLAQHPELEDIIKRVVGQIDSIAVVHGLQSRLGDGDVVLCELIEQIVRDCVELERLGAPPEVPRLAPGVKLTKDYSVSIALVLNELIMNACKHRLVRADESPFTVDIARGAGFVEVVIRNRTDASVPVPQIASGLGLGGGLSIAKALMPHSGGTLSIARIAEWFEARLVLAPPAILQ